MDGLNLKSDEKAIFSLRSLYHKYGYRKYKMSKFEEYDLYVRNKNFLVSDNIITFTDTDGKLMALKPDVTLSIVKNAKETPGEVKKVYYNENVYRVSKGTLSFKEIMQVGLECIGSVDDYTVYEVIMLALMSLSEISDDYILDISHLGVVSGIIGGMNISEDRKKQILKCIGEKNLPELLKIAGEEGLSEDIFKKLLKTYTSFDEAEEFLKEAGCFAEADEIKRIVGALERNGYKEKIHLDFSLIGDTSYYNGFIFKGFIKGIPAGVLSGGQYDNLMRRMKKKEKAIGFAVYLDMLERIGNDTERFDIDTVILYDESCGIDDINNAVKLLAQGGESITAQKAVPEKLRYRRLVRLNEKGVEIIENNA